MNILIVLEAQLAASIPFKLQDSCYLNSVIYLGQLGQAIEKCWSKITQNQQSSPSAIWSLTQKYSVVLRGTWN